MPKFVINVEPFWQQELKDHTYARTVDWSAKNFDHLNKEDYNTGHLLQSFNEELPLCVDAFKDVLDAHTASVSWTCIKPNVILPTHKDTFYTLRQEHNVELDDCYRYLIFLEDWIFGQYVGFEHCSITKWKAGDVWCFTGHELHYAVNASASNFHSCQVSTFS
jgi:hypothetical protein